MSFADRPPSTQWLPLMFKGDPFAEVWFKPEGEPFGLTFRVPRPSFAIAGIGPLLTAENLLKAVAVAADDVESCRVEGVAPAGAGGSEPGLQAPFPQPSPDVTHLTIHVRLKPPPQPAAGNDQGAPDIPAEKWQDLEARWKAVLGLEAAMVSLRSSMEGARAELEAAWARSLAPEEKLHALSVHVTQWTKAKSRIQHVLPKAREFIHRATWILGTPERKKLEETYKERIQPQVPFPEIDQAFEQMEGLVKERQLLSAQGTAVLQECKAVAGEVQSALRTLQSTAAARAAEKRQAANKKGKFF